MEFYVASSFPIISVSGIWRSGSGFNPNKVFKGVSKSFGQNRDRNAFATERDVRIFDKGFMQKIWISNKKIPSQIICLHV